MRKKCCLQIAVVKLTRGWEDRKSNQIGIHSLSVTCNRHFHTHPTSRKPQRADLPGLPVRPDPHDQMIRVLEFVTYFQF